MLNNILIMLLLYLPLSFWNWGKTTRLWAYYHNEILRLNIQLDVYQGLGQYDGVRAITTGDNAITDVELWGLNVM